MKDKKIIISNVETISVSYEPFFAYLKRNDISQTYLEDEYIIPTGTMQLLRENRPISLSTMFHIMKTVGIESAEDFLEIIVTTKKITK